MRIIKCKISDIAKNAEAALFLKQTAERAHEIRTTLYLLCKICIIELFNKNEAQLPATKADMQRLFKDASMILPKGKGRVDA